MHDRSLSGAIGSFIVAAVAASASAQELSKGMVEVDGQDHPYRLLEPAALEEGTRYPLVLFLHGAGERGSDNEKQLAYLPQRMNEAAMRERFPAFLLAPQCPDGTQWGTDAAGLGMGGRATGEPSAPLVAAMKALREVVRSRPIDLDRIYITGLSMGGGGCWELAARYPGWFAAAVPICGGGDPASAERLAGLPLSVWHGGADGVVPPRASRQMSDAVLAAGGTVDYHLLEGVGHDSWTAAYGPRGCLDWLFEQRRDPARERRAAGALLAEVVDPDERVAFLGDSITQGGNNAGGYVDQVRASLAAQSGVEVIPAGISGHKVPDLLRRFERDVVEKGATLVFIYIGINDVWHSQSGRGTPVHVYEAGLRELIARLHDSGATVVLATPSVIGERVKGGNALDGMLEEYAAVSRRVAAETGVVLCDLQQAFHDHLAIFNPEDRDRGILTTDGVHLNAAGNTLVATEAARALRAAVARRKATPGNDK